MKSAQSSPTKLKANAIPFPAPSQLSSPSPQGEEAQSPPVELKYQREEDTELFAPTSVQSSTPSTAQQQPGAGNKAPEQPQQLYATPTALHQPPFTSNSLGIAFPASSGHAPLQSHATPAPLHSTLRFPASEHPLPPFKGRSMSLGGIMSPLGPSPPLPPPFDHSAQAPLYEIRSLKSGEELQRGYSSPPPGVQPPGAPSPLQHPHLHPSPPALHHHHSFPALPQHPLAFAFPPPPPPSFSPLSPPLYPPPSPAFYASPPTPQLYPVGPPSLRHHHSFSYSSSHSSQSIEAPTSFNISPITPLNHNFPASPPLLALSAIDQAERPPSNSSTTTTCDVWDCFAPATCEVSPCSCVLCHRHLRVIIHGARVVEVARTRTRAAGAEDDIAAQGRMKKLFECVGCRTQSQAVQKGEKEEQEDLTAELDGFELGSFGVRDLPASPTTEATSPPASSPPPRPRKVTLPSTIIQPAFPLTQAVTSRSRSASSPAMLGLPESSNPSPFIPVVRERVYSAPFSLPGGLVVRQEPATLDLDDPSTSLPSFTPLPTANRTILRLDNIPWLVTAAEIAQWLPEGCQPRLDTPSPSIYIVLVRETGRTDSCCFVDNLEPGAIIHVIKNRQDSMLRERPIGVKAVAHDELLQALFHQVPKGVKLDQTSPCNLPPFLPPKEELDLLIEACRKGGAGRRTVSYHPERPFLNIVQLIEKFPWDDKTLWSYRELQNVFECAEEAAKIALSTSHRDWAFFGLAERLKSIVITSAVFTTEHKERMRNVQPLGPIRHRKSFPSRPNPPRAPNSYFHPPSPTSYRPRRGSLLGPNGSARRPSLVGAPSGLPFFPPLPSPIEHHPTALPLSPPETPPGLSNVPLMRSPPQARRSKSVGLLSGKGGWGAMES